jgi:hypothetical protein
MLKDAELVLTLDTLIALTLLGRPDEVARAGVYDRPQQPTPGSSRVTMVNSYSCFELSRVAVPMAFTIDLVVALTNAGNLLETPR